jgi:hypothetical protein
MMQVVFSAANGEPVECGEDQGVVQGIQGPPEDEEGGNEGAADGDETGAATATGQEEHPPPKGQDTDAHGFPVKDSFFITLAQLPHRVHSIMVQVSNFAGSGMSGVKMLCARVVDATEEDPVRQRDLFVFTMPKAKGTYKNRTVAVLARLHKESAGMRIASKLVRALPLTHS